MSEIKENVYETERIFNNNLTRSVLIDRYKEIREFSLKICESLETEDFVIQPVPDVSPTKWHLAHTSWFFEQFVLDKANVDYKSPNDKYAYLFNSYYVQAGERWFRPHRGLLSRPTVKEIIEYRLHVDEAMVDFLEDADDDEISKFAVTIDIGLHHEQQHQELMITDIKYVFSINPLYPTLIDKKHFESDQIDKIKWISFDEGIYEIGHNGDGFFYDNEKPFHKALIHDFKIANRLITNEEYIEFIEDGGYKNAVLWLSEGFAKVEENNWEAPLYWRKISGEWWYYTLSGFRKVNPNEPVCHVSFFEAEAYAHWVGARLVTEFEWEAVSNNLSVEGNFVDNHFYHPVSLKEDNGSINQMFGDVWEWTRSDYAPYPGYKVPPGAIGEYNGKFMSNQVVLRGGSCATSKSHIRNTYRNFFQHYQRWQFSGIRLAKDN